MIDIKYANAYREVLEILKYIPIEDYNKIPKNKIEVFEANSNKEYEFIYNPNKTLDEQNVSEGGQAIIGLLFRDYWATEEQRNKIIAKQDHDRQEFEKEKRTQYNPDEIFKSKIIIKSIERQEEKHDYNNLPIEVTNENYYHKLISFLKKLFHLK